jgi:hypothetical protein
MNVGTTTPNPVDTNAHSASSKPPLGPAQVDRLVAIACAQIITEPGNETVIVSELVDRIHAEGGTLEGIHSRELARVSTRPYLDALNAIAAAGRHTRAQ